MALITLSGVKKSFVTSLLFEDVSFEIGPRDKAGLVGVNGCGKTTLLNIITGAEPSDEGTVMRARDLRIGTMEQSVAQLNETVYECTLSVFSALMERERELDRIDAGLSGGSGDMNALIARSASLRERFAAEGGLTYKSRVKSALTGLGFTSAELDRPMGELSGGERNKVQLARVLLSDAGLLLLDEPTNHLDIESVAWLEDFLCAYRGAFIAVSHDRYFLDRVTNRTLELKNRRLFASRGNYSRHIELTGTEQESIRRQYQRTKKEIQRIEGIVEQQRRFGRERNFITAASKQKQIERLRATLVAPERETDSIRFHFTAKEVSGNDVLMAEGLSKAYDKPILRDATFRLGKGERVFLLGANGCGKTTLLRLLMGEEAADAGTFRFGAHVKTGYYDQNMRGLHENSTVIEEVRDAYPLMSDTEIRSALGAFLIRGDDVFKEIKKLSGGERARVQLLKLMLSGANLLLLDEPTNHLDIASREALEGALEDYEGAMLIVTHDRYLVNRLAGRVLFMEQCGLKEYIGGYDDMLEARKREGAAEPVPEGEAKPSQYHEQKQRQSAINRAAGEAARAEARVGEAEAELARIEADMFEAASDYQRAAELAQLAEEKRAQTEKLYSEWEQAEKNLARLTQ